MIELRHIREGLKWGYPICCILDFSIFGSGASDRGVIQHGDGWYVPCRLCKHKAITLAEQHMILNGGYDEFFIGDFADGSNQKDFMTLEAEQ